MSKVKATEVPVAEVTEGTVEQKASESEIAKQTASKTVAQQKKSQEVQEDKMYLGPTIVGVVRRSTVFKNGVLPAKVENCVKKFPAMKKLFVTMKELPMASKELRKKQSALGAIYAQVIEKTK